MIQEKTKKYIVLTISFSIMLLLVILAGLNFYLNKVYSGTPAPTPIYIVSNNKKYKSNIGSSCWTYGHKTSCTDTLGPTQMTYKETIKTKENKLKLDNMYGSFSYGHVYTKDSLTDIRLTYKNGHISLPNVPGTYYIVIGLNTNQGKVSHSFKVIID